MIEIKPTRTELLKLKKRIRLAKTGHSLLKRKRDGLIQALFKMLDDAKQLDIALTNSYNFAERKMAIARALDGNLLVKSASFANTADPNINVKSKTIMGIKVPEIRSEKKHFTKKFYERGYGVIGTTATIDKAAEAYEELLSKIIVAAELETILKKILSEVEKTKRRVNALEYNIIPNMNKTASLVGLHLEEMEREDIFRLKKFKMKKGGKIEM